jgi:hypothetical protein
MGPIWAQKLEKQTNFSGEFSFTPVNHLDSFNRLQYPSPSLVFMGVNHLDWFNAFWYHPRFLLFTAVNSPLRYR